MTIEKFHRLSDAEKHRAVLIAIAQDMEGHLLVTSGMLARVSLETDITWRRDADFSRIVWLELKP